MFILGPLLPVTGWTALSPSVADEVPSRLAVGRPVGESVFVKERLLQIIHRSGPIPFEVFMEGALYGPDGYFSSNDLRSHRTGDFLTSPEVSDWFGTMLSRFVTGERERVGAPFTIVEVAAGSGSLLRPMAARQPADVWAVEVSPAARRELSRLLGIERVVSSVAQLPSPIRGILIANELIDNLPMSLAQLTDRGWRERWVGADDGDLALVDAPVRPEVEAWLGQFAGSVELDGWVEVQLGAAAWLRRSLDLLVAGAVVLIDYGDTKEGLQSRRATGTLRTYRGHHLGPHPLDEPGATDITADVNFSALVEIAEKSGAAVTLERQDDFLIGLGLLDEIAALRTRELELARADDELARLAVRTERTAAETLIHPRGLGDYRVLIARK